MEVDTAHMVAALRKLAWHEHARGRACCAQTAWKLANDLEACLEPAERMAVTKEGTLA